MLQSRLLLAARPGSSSSSSSGGVWESFKSSFKSKFMIGDTYEHYIPPRPSFQNRDSRYPTNNQDSYRLPSPGSQPDAQIPRGYPETEFDISLAKRAALKLTPSGNSVERDSQMAEKEKFPLETATYKFLPRHIPQPAWMYNKESLKRIRRFYLETGLTLPGVPSYLMQTTYRPVEKYQVREEWEQIDIIRDIRVPRL